MVIIIMCTCAIYDPKPVANVGDLKDTPNELTTPKNLIKEITDFNPV